jgi:uncharacterized repeat protein (TIGR01451 family)
MFSFFRRQNKRKIGTTDTAKAKLLVEALEERSLPSTVPMRGILFGVMFNNPPTTSSTTPVATASVAPRDEAVHAADGVVALNQGPALGKIQLFGIDTTPYINPGILTSAGEPVSILPASISGFVYSDANNNGFKDGGETGIAGSVITLTGANDQGPVSETTTTDANGFYQFTNLRPGTYNVLQDEPAGWLDGKDTAGSTGGTVTNDQIAGVSLAAGINSTNNNFGELAPSSLSGFVYVDANNNGIKDAGEAPIAGVTITLTGFTDQGPITAQATTDPTGFYQFQNLRPGNYAIVETQPANYLNGQDTVGTQGGSSATDTFSNIVLPAGVAGINNNFGEQTNADLSIVKTVSPTSVQVGGTLTYTMTVTNQGPFKAQNVQVLDTLPAGVTYQSVTGSDWTLSQAQGTVTAALSSLDVGASSQFTITVKAPAVAGTLTNTATVSSTTPDANPTNNSSTATTTVVAAPPPPSTQDNGQVGVLGGLPALGKVQLFGIDIRPYLAPGVLNELTLMATA